MFGKLALLVFATAPLAAAAQQRQTPPLQAVPHPAESASPNAPLPAVVPAGRPVIGLVLEGGGALGLAHIGVLMWMEEHHVPVDRIAGASMGALIAALYATDHTPEQMSALAANNTLSDVFLLETPYSDLSYRRRQDRREDPSAIVIGLKHDAEVRNALFGDRGVNAFLASTLFRYDNLNLDYNRLPIPYRCVATDLNTLQTMTFTTGPLPQAVRASISIPGVFPPVKEDNGHMLVDGGILDNLPTDVVRQELHAGVVIAVHLETEGAKQPVDTSSIVAVLDRAFTAGVARNVAEAEKQADVLIKVPEVGYNTTDYGRAGVLIQAGYKAAEANSAALLRYALSPADWQEYVAARKSREAAPPGLLREVRIQGGSKWAQNQVLHDMKPLEGHPLSAAATLNALKPVESNGSYSAAFSTFDPAKQTQTGAPANASDTGMMVRLGHDPIGPPYLMVGGEVQAETSNVTQLLMNLRFVDQDLGGYGSELRMNAQLGYRTDVSGEYYRLLTPKGLFFEPQVGAVREPVYIWQNQERVAERLQQNLVAGAEAGWTIGNSMQVSAQWLAQDTHWAPEGGTAGGPYISGTSQMGLLHLDIDRESSGVFSPQGFRLSAAVGGFYHAVQSSNAPVVMIAARRTISWSPNNIVGMGLDVDSYLRTNVAQPFRFTLGGPGRLAASSIDEYRGTDTGLARVGYLHRLAPLPTGLGHGLYSMIAYEAGEVWSPEQRTFLRQDGTLGLVAATPLGAITVGVAVGDAGRRKIFFTLGRLF